MNRTKWVRLIVRDLGDVVRWANLQQARHIGEFRYRLINGRETVSFRLYPDYAIEIGTRDIVVVCHVNAHRWRRAAWSVCKGAIRAGAALLHRIGPAPAPVLIKCPVALSAEIEMFPQLGRQSPVRS